MDTEKQIKPTHFPTKAERSSNKVSLQSCEVTDPTFSCSLFYSLHTTSQTNNKTVISWGSVRLNSSKSKVKSQQFFKNVSASIHLLAAGEVENILCPLSF
jgi:hypothetical protein